MTLFLCFIAWGAKAQNITFNHLTTDNGLSQISVNSLYMDEKGFLWIATREGLNRYDGNFVKTYKLKKNDPGSLFCNNITRITGDKQGKVYLMCTEGIASFDIRSQKFTTLLKGSVDAIYYHDNLYIARRNTIEKFDAENHRFKTFITLPVKGCSITCMFVDNRHNLWIGTDKEGLFYIDRSHRLKHVIGASTISSIYQDSTGDLWIGTWSNGMYRIAPNGRMTCIRTTATNGLLSNFVRSFCEDNEGNIWIGTFHGLNKYNKRTNTFNSYVANNEPGSLSNSSIWCIIKDNQGTLWMGTYFGGVNYFNPEYEIYTMYRSGDNEHKELSSPIVGRMTQDEHGNLWICTEGGGLNVFNPTTHTFKWYKHREGANSISQNNVKAIYYDRQHDVMWIGTHLGGLNKLDLRNGRFTIYRSRPNDASTLPSDIVRDIVPYGNQLIIGTQSGVCLFNPANGRCSQLFTSSRMGREIKMVASLLIDKAGTLWIAATGQGVYSYRFDTKRLKKYAHNESNPNSLSNNNVNNIMQDSYGNLWFSTSGCGLDRYRSASNDFDNFDMKKNGLASDCVYEVRESSIKRGNLILITNQGFSEFNPWRKTFRNYGIMNGFPLSAINENALYITTDGTIYLGGVQGMLAFSERKLHLLPKPYQFILSRLTVNGKEVVPGDDTGILDEDLCYSSRIVLKSDQSMFSIYFSTSNYIPANQDELYYRLEGFSTQWNKIYRNQSVITYTNLDPGTYTLVLKSSRAGVKEARIVIHILPPWYRTWWAYLLYLIILGSLSWYLITDYKTRIRLGESLKYEKKHTEDVEELNQSKLRFFTNISHEFRTPLTLIIGEIELLMQSRSFTPSMYKMILGIYKSCNQLQDLITELLDFRKQEQGHMKIKVAPHNIVSFLYENYLLFDEYAAGKQINIIFNKAEDDIEVWFDQRQMQKVINNLLSNAMKHTRPKDSISITVSKEDKEVKIMVSDSGEGIDAKEIERIFDRFYQAERLDSLNTGAGTGIGLALTKGIIELHHGSIEVESELGKGTSFIITLPLGKAHFKEDQIATESNNVQQISIDKKEELTIEEPLEIDEEIKERIKDARMLIVEDDESIRNMLNSIFKAYYQTTLAVDGEDAWEKIQEEEPDIVLSDVVMPRMSGTELCRKIKGEFNTCHIPVVLLTARTAVEHTVEGLKLGADDYITKPFNVNILISRCNNLVNSRRILQEKFSKQPQMSAQMLATNPIDKKMLDQATAIIEQHLDDPEFNVNIFAREMGLARTNLFAKLKAITGQTPNDFIQTIRLHRGALLLRNNPELNVTEISDQIGFSSSRYFSKCFKEIYHVSPLAYRNDTK
jgi:signal transduction histidine kinase/ligand-binding sensor domain-containing protein/DNA-binding response OmpR family regulator